MAVNYDFPPWQQGNPGVEIPATLQRSRQLRQQQAVQAQDMAMQAAEWQQKQAQYQKQAEMLAQRALQEQEYQKGVSDLQTRSQIPPGQPGAMTPQQIQTQAALLQMQRMSGGGGSSAGVMNALKPAPSLQPLTIPGAPTPKTMPSAGFTDKLNSILQTAGRSPIAAPAAPPAAWSFGNRLVTPKELAPPPTSVRPTSVRELPVLRDDGTPDPTQFAIAGPKGVVVKSRPRLEKGASGPKVTDINKYHEAKQHSTTLTAILNSPTKLTEWAGLHTDGDEAEAKDLIQDKLDAAQEDVEALQDQYKNYDFSRGSVAAAAGGAVNVPTATNPKTGQKIQFVNGKWQPIQP